MMLICPQLNQKRQAFSRLSGCCLQGGYTRLLLASKTALSCGHFILENKKEQEAID